MYNRYIPTADGAYRRETVLQAAESSAAPPAAQPQSRQSISPRLSALDAEDLLVLAVLTILLLNGDGDDRIATLITIAAFLLL